MPVFKDSTLLTTKRFIILALLAVSAPLAQARVYFEYAPDPWRSTRLVVSANDTPSQFFQSASDFDLTGFDFWVDNTGSSGSVTFTLLDDSSATLAEKTITLQHLAAVPGGNKFHVELSQPIAISHYRTYSIQIESTLIGFGLYYTNRLEFLEHNLEYTNEYVLGVATLGAEEQSFTFKFALHNPEPDPNVTPEAAEEEPTASTTVATVITNARIVSVTDTTALAAWTTNVAADSRMTIRTQLNPLYLYTSGYDPTLELEHTLLITGLAPNVNYFADFFSQQTVTEPILTTYSVAFKTLAAQTPVEPPAPPPPPAPVPEPEPAPAPEPEPEPEPAPAPTPEPDVDDETPAITEQTPNENLPTLTFGEGEGSESFSINWSAPASGEPSGGYRIDIFDADHRLVRQLRAPAGTYSRNVAVLPAGTHDVIVYADNNGVYEKVGSPTIFEATKARSPLFWFWYLMGVVFAVGIGLAFFFSRREKTELTPLE